MYGFHQSSKGKIEPINIYSLDAILKVGIRIDSIDYRISKIDSESTNRFSNFKELI